MPTSVRSGLPYYGKRLLFVASAARELGPRSQGGVVTRNGGPTRPRAVTLQDVAREAGGAVSTVSRALSSPERVNATTREHVQAIARSLGYRPNRMAQALPTGRTRLLAVLVPDIMNPHNFGLVRGAAAQARRAGVTLVIGDIQQSPDLEATHLDRLASFVDGFILAASRLPDADL